MTLEQVVRLLAAGLWLALAGCSAAPLAQRPATPCDAGEATYACQVQRYQDVSVQ